MINLKKAGTNATITISGPIDKPTAEELDKTIKSAIEQITALTVDFKDVEHISPAGLRVLLSAHKNLLKKGGLTITNVNKDVLGEFEAAGFTDILSVK